MLVKLTHLECPNSEFGALRSTTGSSSSEMIPIDHFIAHLLFLTDLAIAFDFFWCWRAQWLQTAEWYRSAGSQLKRWWGVDRRDLVDHYVNTGRPKIKLPSQSAPCPALRTSALAVCRCHDDIRVARNDSCGHEGIQISRPGSTNDPCWYHLTPNFARSQRVPLFVCALNRNATNGKQRCLGVQVGLAVSETQFETAFVLGGRQVSPCERANGYQAIASASWR